MLSWLTDFWLIKLILGSGAVVIALCVIAALWFGKPFVDGVMKLLGPILSEVGAFLAMALAWIKDVLFNEKEGGLKDILDGWRTIVTVGLIVFSALTLYSLSRPRIAQNIPTMAQCKPQIDILRKDFRFVPRR